MDAKKPERRPRRTRGTQAEEMGFEPMEACTSPVFKTGAINRSTTPPSSRILAQQADLNHFGRVGSYLLALGLRPSCCQQFSTG